MKQHFPKWLFHASLPARTVASQEEQDNLGPEWAETQELAAAAAKTADAEALDSSDDATTPLKRKQR